MNAIIQRLQMNKINGLLELCKKNRYFISGGSDYHGSFKPNVDIGVGYGNLKVPDNIINDWVGLT